MQKNKNNALPNNSLHIAAESGNLVEVQSHVNNFDINAKGEYDRTALVIAAEKGHADVVKLLLTLNVDVNVLDVSTLDNDTYPSDM